MAVRISDLEAMAVGAITKNDVFEIEQSTQRKSYKVSAQAIAEFCKTVNNGGYKGESTKSLDEFDHKDAGVYWWHGTPPLSGMAAQGVLEIISATPPDETPTEAPMIIERFTNGNDIWTRCGCADNWSIWSVLANKNGCVIDCGNSADMSEGVVKFHMTFSQAPVVTATPKVSGTANNIYLINVTNVTRTGFSVLRYALRKTESKQVTTTHYTDNPQTQQEEIEWQTVETIASAWDDGEFDFDWIALTPG